MAKNKYNELLIADFNNFRVRKIDSAGIISTYAGTGINLKSGDGNPATAADIGSVWGVLIDKTGNVYLSESQNYGIRKIDTNGIINTIAGRGTNGYSGDGGPATAAEFGIESFCSAIDKYGNLIISDPGNNRIRMIINSKVGVASVPVSNNCIKV